MEYIESTANNFIKMIKKLKTKKSREDEKLFLAEGIKFLDFKTTPYAIIISEELIITDVISDKIKAFGQNTKIVKVSKKIFLSVTTQETPQGMLFVYRYLDSDISKLKNNIVVLDKVSDPGNLGTIIRLADASGYSDILLTKGSTDIYNEKAVRSSMGSILSMNITYMEDHQLLDLLKNNNYMIHTTTLDRSSIDYCQMKLSEKNAFIFGNEANGVSKFFFDNSQENIIIPIYGTAESLNVAVASGIILYKAREILERSKTINEK